jgi:cardiolipin synthase
MIVDECWCSVGSANFDNRSLRLNEEANLNVLCGRFAREHTAIFETDRDLSREVTLADWRARPLREKVAGRVGCLLRSQI